MRKAKPFMKVWTILGTIYAVLGGSFLILGGGLFLGLPKEVSGMIGGTFGLIGGTFLLLGICFLLIQKRKSRRNRQLVQSGRYVLGEIVEISPNYSIRTNGRSPYILHVRYRDSSGVVHMFRSGNLRFHPGDELLHRKVKVFADENFRHSYVELDGVLPEIIVH